MADDDELRLIRERAREIAERSTDESTREMAEALAESLSSDPDEDPWHRLQMSVYELLWQYAATLPPPQPGEVGNKLAAITALRARLCWRQRTLTEEHINAAIDAMPEAAQDYDQKLDTVREFNRLARYCNSVYRHPVAGRPALLLAVSSHDGKGRFTFEDVASKKRSGSYKHCRDFRPVKLVEDPRRDRSDR